jgi:hypothetical protein
MTTAQKNALQIGLLSLLGPVIYFIIPEPVAYKGPAVDLLPLANYFVIACGIGGIVFSVYLYFKEVK